MFVRRDKQTCPLGAGDEMTSKTGRALPPPRPEAVRSTAPARRAATHAWEAERELGWYPACETETHDLSRRERLEDHQANHPGPQRAPQPRSHTGLFSPESPEAKFMFRRPRPAGRLRLHPGAPGHMCMAQVTGSWRYSEISRRGQPPPWSLIRAKTPAPSRHQKKKGPGSFVGNLAGCNRAGRCIIGWEMEMGSGVRGGRV